MEIVSVAPAAMTAAPDQSTVQRRRRLKARLWKLAAHALLLGLLFVMLYPVLWLISSSLRHQDDIFHEPGLWPTSFTLQNYVNGWHFFQGFTFGDFFINSFLIAFLCILGNLVACSLAAYAFARLRFPLKNLFFALMLGSIMLPVHVQLIPQYIVFLNLGWVNTYIPLVMPKWLATDAFFVFLMVQFMRNLPRELEEAAEIDGASFWHRYWHIILPLSMPAIVTTALFTFIFTYNDYLSQLIYLTSLNKTTVPLALRLFIDSGGGTSNFGGLFAMSVLALGPVIGFFLATQRFIVQGFATTGLK